MTQGRDVQRYSADPPHGFRVIPLDVLTALFHLRSGTTHLVAEPVPAILTALGERAMSVAELIAHLAALYDVDGEEEALAGRLAELEAEGLVWRV